jgi:cytochrome c oxidase assembly factor CtaG/ferredoxin
MAEGGGRRAADGIESYVSDNVMQAVMQSWSFPLGPTLGVLVAAVIYLRGWRLARATRPEELPAWRMQSFMAGLLTLWLALASPIDALGQFLLIAHMTQHLILMSIAPPLLILGAPQVPMLRGLPRVLIRDGVAQWINLRPVHWLQRFFTHPLFGWIGLNLAFIAWHAPPAYELALRSNSWHYVEHICFFVPALSFWWTVLQPWPSQARWSRWMIPLYLAGADLVNTGVSASLSFGSRPVYPTYVNAPRIFGISALQDQVVAGAGMWVIASFITLIPLSTTIYSLLEHKRRKPAYSFTILNAAQSRAVQAPFDLLRVPFVGKLLRARYGRTSLQGVSLLLMTVVIVHGLWGTRLTAMNLAGALVWNIFRPLNLFLFVFAGNLFCMACPFTLPRALAKYLGIARLRWPAWLKHKWTPVVLMTAFFWAYEQFALWDSPRTTALLLLAYILGALVVDSIFEGASFCKYVCPIGQFNFVASMVSPLELGAKSQAVCARCTTRDCIRGNATQRGCELELYVPQKVGNLDCTLCMDCVKACPHDNIAITAQLPARDLVRDPIRSSLRRLSSRMDIATLVLVVIFSSLASAAVMIAPVGDRLQAMEARYPLLGSGLVTLPASFALLGTLLLLAVGVAKAMQVFSTEKSVGVVFSRFSLALLPLGMAMWAAHLMFHVTLTLPSLGPALQQAWADLGRLLHGGGHAAASAMAGMSQAAMANMPGMSQSSMAMMLTRGFEGTSLLSVQVLVMDLGLLFSMYVGWRLVRQMTASAGSMAAMLSVWVASSAALYAVCVWVLTQPMEMRGMAM